MQGEVAAGRMGVSATVLYTQASGPLKNRHARALATEAEQMICPYPNEEDPAAWKGRRVG